MSWLKKPGLRFFIYGDVETYDEMKERHEKERLNRSMQTEEGKIRLKAFKLCQHSENYQKTLEAVQRMNMDDKKEVKIQYGNKKSTGIHTGAIFTPPPGFAVLFRVKEK